MSVEKGTRRYQLRKRADAVQDTRRRITEAAVELHGSIGPARTTITAVAERAGVQRQTVYRPGRAVCLLRAHRGDVHQPPA